MNVYRANLQSGFTLIELVSVMVLLGILAVSAIPSFTGTDDFSAYAAQDQIIAGARMAQQRAMYDRAAGNCYRLHISSNTLQVQLNSVNIGPTEEWRSGIVIDADVTIAGDTDIYFDGLGNAFDACPAVLTKNSLNATVSIGSPAILNVCINPVGYIYAC